MRLPTISQYVESVANAEGLFRSLHGLQVQTDVYAEPILRAGNSSVLFRVSQGGQEYALKCYVTLPERLAEVYSYLEGVENPYCVRARYLADEVYVYDAYGQGAYYPVVLMEWQQGDTLGIRLARLCRQRDKEAIASLSRKFDDFALWLLRQPFAHGDLKHDNLLVSLQGELRLIDFDGMFLPQFAGMQCSLIGARAYQHPARDENSFNKRIDDYSIAIISLSLRVLSDRPELFEQYNDRENIIFDASRILNGEDTAFNMLMNLWQQQGQSDLYELSRFLCEWEATPDALISLLDRSGK